MGGTQTFHAMDDMNPCLKARLTPVPYTVLLFCDLHIKSFLQKLAIKHKHNIIKKCKLKKSFIYVTKMNFIVLTLTINIIKHHM